MDKGLLPPPVLRDVEPVGCRADRRDGGDSFSSENGHVFELVCDHVASRRKDTQRISIIIGGMGGMGADLLCRVVLLRCVDMHAVADPCSGERKHAAKLRILAIVLMVGLPLVLLMMSHSHVLAAFAVLSHLVGVFAARWLFFAEAEHVVGLYYGKR